MGALGANVRPTAPHTSLALRVRGSRTRTGPCSCDSRQLRPNCGRLDHASIFLDGRLRVKDERLWTFHENCGTGNECGEAKQIPHFVRNDNVTTRTRQVRHWPRRGFSWASMTLVYSKPITL